MRDDFLKKSRRERYAVRDDVVRAWGFEPQRISAREPKSRMSANSIMPAYEDYLPTVTYLITGGTVLSTVVCVRYGLT